MSCTLRGIANRLKSFKFNWIIPELAKFLHLLYSYEHCFPRWRLRNMVNVKGFHSTEGRSQCLHGLRRGSEGDSFKIIWWKLYNVLEQLVRTAVFELVQNSLNTTESIRWISKPVGTVLLYSSLAHFQTNFRPTIKLSLTLFHFYIINWYMITAKLSCVTFLFQSNKGLFKMIVAVLTTCLERTRLSCWCLKNHKGCTYIEHL